MSRIDLLFQSLRRQGRKALMPFITAGDPDLSFTADLLRVLVERGSHMCEIGIPYSDPIADGPVIQSSYTRALGNKIRLDAILETLTDVTPSLAAPIVTMVSYAIIYRQGPRAYVEAAQRAGVSGLIVPDLPIEEADSLAADCRLLGLDLIPLVAPTTSRERAKRIAERASGFIYYVSVAGVTGARNDLPPDVVENVAWLKQQTDVPVCVGFGISRPEHVRMLAPVADGLIVGSALVRRMAEVDTKPRDVVLREIGDYVAELVAALDAET